MKKRPILVIALALPLVACGGAIDALDETQCRVTEPTALKGDWRNGFVTDLTRAAGDADHSAQDVVVHPDEPFVLRGKFAYGPISKDLENEEVAAFVRTDGCDAWALVGEAITDRDGRVAVPTDALLSQLGRYDYRLIVRGDLSVAKGSIFVVEKERPTVVFDIDGTLTTGDLELVEGAVIYTVGTAPEKLFDLAGPLTKEQFLLAANVVFDEDADLQPGAVELVRHWESEGYQVAYLTGRPYLYDHLTRDWLTEHELPEGPLFLAQDILDAFPTESGVQAFKRKTLERIDRELGLDVQVAYGNATTDICAYALAGIDPADTFIIGSHAGEACEGYDRPNAVPDYPSHLLEL